jgi:hypothetical protein
MCLLLREAMKCFRISVHKQFVSLSMGAEKGKTRLRDELSNYCVINDVPKSAFGKVRDPHTPFQCSTAGHTCASAGRRSERRSQVNFQATRTTRRWRCRSPFFRAKSSTRYVHTSLVFGSML